MKKVIIATLFFLLACTLFSQEINKLTDGMTIKKGTIVLDNGQQQKFTDLKLQGMNLTYSDEQGVKYNSDLSGVYTISNYKSYLKKGIIWGGATGFFFGFFFASVNTDDQTFQPLHYLPGALLGTVIGGGVGALIGHFKSRDVLCYKNAANFKPTLGFVLQPANGDYRNDKLIPGLSLKINF